MRSGAVGLTAGLDVVCSLGLFSSFIFRPQTKLCVFLVCVTFLVSSAMDWCLPLASLLVVLIVLVTAPAESAKLNDYILDFRPLTYDRVAVHNNHHRVRRSLDSDLHIRFNAYERDFQLRLQPAEGIFSNDHKVYRDGVGIHTADTSFIYQGTVQGDPHSSVHLSVHNGSIEGHIKVDGSLFHIEPASKYLNSPIFHTVIYPDTHLDKDPYRARREAEVGSCALDHLQEWMAASSQLEEPAHISKRAILQKDMLMTEDEQLNQPYHMYSADNNAAANIRVKRADDAKKTCSLHMIADPLLFDFFKNKRRGQTVTDDLAEEDIIGFFSAHVKAISDIYSTTIFETYDKSMAYTGIRFQIHRTTIMNPPTSTCGTYRTEYCANNLDVSNFLDLTSLDNHDNFCLAFTFTYRDFSGGTLGLAWVATEQSIQSGVCGRHSTFTGGKEKSLNTGIVTIINFGKTVPNRVSQLTFAHEAGHNFGSPHDIGSDECAPYGTRRSDASDGNYIMFPSATGGDQPHNDDFSRCSKDNMTRILKQVFQGIRTSCFITSNEAFCGNKITEPGEECDCGFENECNTTASCCLPREEGQSGGNMCKLNPGAECSPDSGPCCRAGCKLIQLNESVVCQAETNCSKASRCNGNNFTCPAPDPKADGSFCNTYTKVCSKGECIAPLCKRISWEECFLTSETGNAADFCYVACKNNVSGECVSSSNSDALAKAENIDFKRLLEEAARNRGSDQTKPQLTLPPGSACDNYRGYCDAFHKCQRVDAQGPFNQLTNLIFNPVTLGRVKDWIVEYWWAVLLMCVGLVVFMGGFIKLFGYNTPSEDPKYKPSREQRARAQGNARGNAKQSSHPQDRRVHPLTTQM